MASGGHYIVWIQPQKYNPIIKYPNRNRFRLMIYNILFKKMLLCVKTHSIWSGQLCSTGFSFPSNGDARLSCMFVQIRWLFCSCHPFIPIYEYETNFSNNNGVFLYMHMHFCHLSKIESIFLKQNNIRSKAFDIYSNILKISQYKEHLNCLKFRFTFFQLTFFPNRKKTPRSYTSLKWRKSEMVRFAESDQIHLGIRYR